MFTLVTQKKRLIEQNCYLISINYYPLNMNWLQLLLLVFLQAICICNYYTDGKDKLAVYSDNQIFGHSTVPVPYGHLIFYEKFVTFNNDLSTQSKNYSTFYHTRSVSKWLKICILLCGDVHPCPGPDADPQYRCFDKRGIHFIHVNARSLLPHKHDIRLLANQTHAACISISETWLDNSIFDTELHIPNYNLFRRDRNRQGGGVCLYIRSDLAFNPRDDLLCDDLEALWIELLLPMTKPFIIGTVYRPPKQTDFYTTLENVFLNNHGLNHSETYILGDFNTDVSLCSTGVLQSSLKSFMHMSNFKQLIQDFTRISNTSSSVIDLILVSDCDKVVQSGVLKTSLSDHFAIYCTRKISRPSIGTHNTVKLRSLKN